jgi:hypothetical protein
MLGTYRKLLLHKPVDPEDPGEVVLLEKTMGCDSTTVRLNLGSLLSIDTCPSRDCGFIGVEGESDRSWMFGLARFVGESSAY